MGNPWAYDFTAVGARKSPLLIVIGSDGDARQKADGGYRASGVSDVYNLIAPDFAFDQLNLSKQFKAAGQANPANYDVVLNLVTDPDQHPKTLQSMQKLLRSFKGRLVNRPEALLRTTRDQVARRLQGIEGLSVPKVLRLRNPKPGAASAAAERAAMQFPLIARAAGTHSGKIIGIVATAGELDAACVGQGEFLMTEFIDFSSADALYRKFRLWSFGGRTILRHMVVSDSWNVHVSARTQFMLEHPDLIEEEERLLDRPEGLLPAVAHNVFAEVRKRMALDFFGMDFGFDREGRVVLFEANATMNFFPIVAHPRFSYLEKILAPSREAFMAMLFPKS